MGRLPRLVGLAFWLAFAAPCADALAQSPATVASSRSTGLADLDCTFGYTTASVDGAPQRYTRTKKDGHRVEFSASEFEPLLRQVQLFHEANPWTARTIRNCPELCDLVANSLEAGAVYQGGAEGNNGHPHALDNKFWSK